MDWNRVISEFGFALLQAIDPDILWNGLPTDSNPITDALAQGDFVTEFGEIDGFSRMAVSKLATICQMVIFDEVGGPEGDGKPKALRRHWYQWYKSKFAQPFAAQMGDVTTNAQGISEMKDLSWTGRLSQTYAWFVDHTDATYKDLWVEDASRMMAQNFETLFQDCHIIVAVEKDSLFGDFQVPAAALGAKAIYSGKGKSSKAAIEKLLRDYFEWGSDWDSTVEFTADTPLIILHISDHDFDGESVIGPTFAEQARRYTPHILEARVGIKPEAVLDAGKTWEGSWYQVKVSNKGYQRWANREALFVAECTQCGHHWAVQGVLDMDKVVTLNVPEEEIVQASRHECPLCNGPATWILAGKNTAHGFEVEALTTRDYRALLVRTLLEVLPFEYIVRRLREDCTADHWQAAETATVNILKGNESYQVLTTEVERLAQIQAIFEGRVRDELYRIGEPHVSDWENDDDDPESQDFENFVDRASWAAPWRPFDRENRTASLVGWLEEEADEAKELAAEEVEVGVSAEVRAVYDIVGALLDKYDGGRGTCFWCKAEEGWGHTDNCEFVEAVNLLT